MKKLFTPQFLLLLITAVILSSCGSSTSITKRRYNKGYYVSHSPNKTTTKAIAKAKMPAAKSKEPLKVMDITPEQTAVTSKTDKITAPITANTTKAPEKTKQSRTNTNSSSTSLVPFKNSAPAEFSVLKPFKSINKAVDQKLSASSGDSLSLFWVVILVLLILFLLGVINGSLGGLIYILLVVALILLILWLLRVL